jgi:hypothetical protein
MIRLSEVLTRARLLYERPVATLPDVVVLDIAAPHAGPSLPLGRYYPIIIETEDERHELEAWLDAPRPHVIAPDLLDRRPSRLAGAHIMLAAYRPARTGWPFLLLCHWPRTYADITRRADLFARGSYTTELFDTEAQLGDHCALMIETLNIRHDLDLRLIAGAGGGDLGIA